MTTSSSKNHVRSKKKTENTKSAFNGIIIGMFEDDGPKPRYNQSRLPKKIVNRLVIHGMSAVHGGDDMFEGLFGPLPLFDKPNYRYLIYSFKVKATNTKDSRIAEHGRICSVFLILKDNFQRFVLNNHMSIEKMIVEYTEKNWEKELDVTIDSLLVLFDKLNDLVEIVDLRAFSYGKAGLIEFADPQVILDEGIITIVEMKTQKATIYLPKEKYDSKMRIKALEKIEEIDMREFGSQLKIIKCRDYLKFKKLLDKHSIQLVT